MYNKVIVQNSKYYKLKAASAAVFLFAVIFAAILIEVSLLNSRNFNGNATEISGTVTAVTKNESELLVELDGQTRYIASPIEDELDDWGALEGKQITLVLPQRQLESQYRWILGIKTKQGVLVDFDKVVAQKRQENTVILAVVSSLTALLVVGSGLLYAWQKRTPANVEKELLPTFCDFTAKRQPTCSLYRLLPLFTAIYAVAVLLFIVAIGVTAEFASDTALIIISVVCAALVVALSTLLLVAAYVWFPQKERKFYEERYPFDLDDLSYVNMRKSTREELQNQLNDERAHYPNRFYDGGNGLICDFTERGITVSCEEEPNVPSAQEVFGEGGEQAANVPHCDFSYEQLQLEAIAHYRSKDRPLFIVVKSRLEQKVPLADGTEMQNDLHFILDRNLLATLKRFNVQTENLDYLLENKARLMAENCPKSAKRHK